MTEEKTPERSQISGDPTEAEARKPRTQMPVPSGSERPKTGRRKPKRSRPRKPGEQQPAKDAAVGGKPAPKDGQRRRPRQRPETAEAERRPRPAGAPESSKGRRRTPDGARSGGRPRRPDSQRRRPRPEPPKPQPKEVPEEILLQYSTHGLKKRPKVAILVLAGIVLVAWAVWKVYPNVLFGVVSVSILVLSVSAFLFPIRYKISNKGVYFRNLMSNEFRTWDRFYDYFVYKDAVQLAFDYRTLRGRVQKGFLVYFDDDPERREELMRIVQANITKPEKPLKSEPKKRGGLTEKQRTDAKPVK